MQIYKASDAWCDVALGQTKILGFQKVLKNPDKVFVWFKQYVRRPNYQDRHYTTREANDSGRRADWAKSPWKKDFVIQVLGSQLLKLGITRQSLDIVNDDSKSDVWQTADDGMRNFLRAELINPFDERSFQSLNIQVTQQAKKPFASVFERAMEESEGDEVKFKELLVKYIDKSMIKTYVKIIDVETRQYILSPPTPIIIREKDTLYGCYESKEIVIGEPNHKWLSEQYYNIEDVVPDIAIEGEQNIQYKHIVNISSSNVIEDKPVEIDF